MYGLKKIGKVFTSKSVGTGPSSYEKGIYRAVVSQRLRNTGQDDVFLQRVKLILIIGLMTSTLIMIFMTQTVILT